jgi:hypothetical protein
VKVGDLVRFRLNRLTDESPITPLKVGVITDLSEPTPMFPLQVATVAFDTAILDGISTRSLEVISESA